MSRDLTDAAQNAAVLARASDLIANPTDHVRLVAATSDATQVGAHSPVDIEAAAAATSRAALPSAESPVHVSVVWAMYKETERILSATEHPHGEDFLHEKIRQMDWLTDGIDHVTWDLVAVDDGCPNSPSSADVAERIVAEDHLDAVTVLRLHDAIDQRLTVTDNFGELTTTDDSRKGGSIAYGMWAAAHHRTMTPPPHARHVIVYTDADLSANLAQVGSLIGPVLSGAAAGAGQRYGLPGSVLVKESGPMTEPHSTGGKPDKTIILFRHFVRATLIPPLAPVLDTQAGFKAFDANTVRQALPGLGGFNETFDVEVLLLAAEAAAAAIGSVPIVFTEDFAATNFPSVDPGERHLAMIRQIVDIHDRLMGGPASEEASRLRTLIDGLSLDGYVAIIEGLRSADPYGADDPILFDTRWDVSDLERLAGDDR